MTVIWYVIGGLLGIALLVLVAYLVSRAASVAHYRAKQEYMRDLMKGAENGKE